MKFINSWKRGRIASSE